MFNRNDAQVLIYFYFLLLPVYGNDFFNCLEHSNNPSFSECGSSVNKWDRLPKQIKPVSYQITIQPFIHLSNDKNFFFQGSINIECRSERRHRHVLLHVDHNLKIENSKIKVFGEKRETVKIESVAYIHSRKWLAIRFYERRPANEKYYIEIQDFSSKFANDSHGFYYFAFGNNGIKRYGANVLLSPFNARKVFPSFDDPGFESRIQLRIIRKDNFVTQSIMEIQRTAKLSDNWEMDIYEYTPSMQIYEFIFSINTFEYVQAYTSTGHLLRLWAPKEKLYLTSFTLNQVKKALTFFEHYLNSSYVFNKLDIVVTTKMPPHETASSTYGCVIFVDEIVFIEPEKTLPRYLQIYVNNIIHEMAHLWIGNVLRLEWFDVLWVIEGLAGYMEQKILTNETPYKHRLATALTQTVIGLFADGSELNHKLSLYPYSSKHVEYYFDDLIFMKGFSLFKMIDGVIGNKNFRFVMSKLVKDEEPEPLTSSTLWRLMDKILEEKEVEVSMEYIMQNWQSKRGYPIVHVELKDNEILMIKQRGNLPVNYGYIWPIPITYLVKNGEERSDHKSIIWLHERKKHIKLDKRLSDDEWYILNQDQLGFFRVNYELSNWILLIHQLRQNHTLIPPIARLQIFDDAFHFYCNGEIPGTHSIFDILTYMKNEEEYTIWKYSKMVIEFLNSLFETRDSYKYFKMFMNNLLSNMLRRIQWSKENHISTSIQMRNKHIFAFACRFENPYCDEQTDIYFKYWLKDHYFIAPLYLYGPILCNGIKKGGKKAWYKTLKALFNQNMSLNQKLIIAQSLACSTDEIILEKFWNKMLTNTTKYKNLYEPLLSSLAKNFYARGLFVKKICSDTVNITKNAFEFSATLAALNNFLLPEKCAATEQLEKIRMKKTSGDNLEMESSSSMAETRKFLFENHLPSLEEWLKNNIDNFQRFQ